MKKESASVEEGQVTIAKLLDGLNWATINEGHFEELEARVANLSKEELSAVLQTLLPTAKQLFLDNQFYKK